ncbi:SDR family NAD(P)-dependent oxidoreductase [Hyphomonas sp. WL0036]|uniref:type I polyketide synthase n=1 Tax=Hyphomonas sediminis TaxID=2866160 RepID=UPI001C7F3790|nr:type I polyketide synthase [Hyphomonas sediminis]MBY9067962.1 SDR family NAD(P)-dependent oxidoreductase [Hyphomonas sediminis]
MADENSIAIVGMAGHFPGARSVREYWNMLSAGRDATRWLNEEELIAAGVPFSTIQDPNYIRATMQLPDMEMFDAGFFGFSPKEAAILDPQHRHFLECSWEALEDAGHMPDKFDGAIGVFGGCGMQAYLAFNLLSNPELVENWGMFLLRHTGNDKDFLTTRVSYLLDLHGPSVGVQTACSTSLVAIHQACQSLLSRECDMALAGGASIDLPHGRGYRYAEGEILSSTGYCRAFDDAADGTLFGSGAAVVALRRLDDALRDGDNIHAVILGSAINNDGARKAGYLAPSIDGQAMAASEALAVAGVEPDSVEYIEAHGTGTLVGDPIELSALQQAYDGAGAGSIGIGSVKTNIGHLDTAAGIASLIKVALAMRGEKLPATLNFNSPNSRFNFGRSPFKVVGDSRDWQRGAKPRRAGVNSLGVGGTNAHVILEEAPARPGAMTSGPYVFPLSAKTKESLDGLIAKWRDFSGDPGPDFCIANAAFTLQTGRRDFNHRAAVVASNMAELADQLSANGAWKRTAATAKDAKPRIVFMFPGGGAQYPNAGRSLYKNNAVFRTAADACFAALEPSLASDLRKVMFASEDFTAGSAALERPTYSLLAVFIVEYGLSKLWESWGVTPDAVIGHSAGEYAAAVLAGVMSLQDAIAVVLERGALFESAPAGGMISVQHDEASVRRLLGDDLDIAVLNSPQVTVVSGADEPLAEFSKRLAAEGIKHAPVRIKVAAHSRMLDSGLERFRKRLESVKLSAPKVDFINNLVGEVADPNLMSKPDYWVNHLRGCVRFADGLSAALSSPDVILVEVGPGQALCALAGLVQSEHSARGCVPTLPTAVDPQDDQAYALSAFGNLWTLGVPVDFARVRKGEGLRRISLPTYAFERQRHWIEPGKGRADNDDEVQQILRRADISSWIEARVFKKAPIETAGRRKRKHVIFSDGSDAAFGLIDRLVARGDSCIVVSHDPAADQPRGDGSGFAFDAGAEDYAPLIEALSNEPSEPDTVLFFWPRLFAGSDKRLGAFDASFTLAKALQLTGWAEGAHFVALTQNALAVSAGDHCDAMQAAVLGPWQMLAAEQSGVRSRVVDLDTEASAADMADNILKEIDSDGGAPVAAWRKGERFTPALERSAIPLDRNKLRERGVYLITGGLGGIGMELAQYLAETVKARLVLVGRSSIPPRESWGTLAEGRGPSADVAKVRDLLALEALGAEVLAISADVSDEEDMQRVLEEVRDRFGAVNGLFHGAGTINDAPMAMKSLEDAHGVLAAKADGAAVLDRLFPEGEVDLFAVFSSTSMLITPPGQSDYVAANAIAESVAASRCDGMIITWGVWSDVGMAKRAADTGASGEGGILHPLLGAKSDSRDGKLHFHQTYSEAALWALAEHRIGTKAVLPGAAYVEIASAAALAGGMGDAVEISRLNYVVPLVIQPRQSRQVRTTLTPLEDDGYHIEVESRVHAGEGWLLHFDASISKRMSADTSPIGQVSCPDEVSAELLTLDSRGVGFGPRWKNVVHARTGECVATAEFVLAPEFASDLRSYRIHPALFDTSFAVGLFLLENDAERGVFAPVSIDEVRIFGALKQRFSAVCRMQSVEEDAASFDIDLRDETGGVLLEIRGASFRRVTFSGEVPTLPNPDADIRERLMAEGIRSAESRAVFEQIFTQGASSIVVTPVSIAQILHLTRAPADTMSATGKKAGDGKAVNAGDPVEQRLAQMCAEILGVDTLGLDEEFLSYGGGSLTGVRLFARIRREMGVELALSALLQAPTIRALAVMVREQLPEDAAETHGAEAEANSGEAGTAEAAEPAQGTVSELPKKPAAKPITKSRWTPLVRMVPGASEKKPVFLIHGAGGTALVFKPLADGLKCGSPVYGVEAQGIDGSLPILETIEEMAELYVRHILSLDPVGPYRLVGYSGGGVIAVEMAHQLKQSGREVEFLCMLDTLAPQEMYRPIRIDNEVKRLAGKMKGWTKLDFGEIGARAVKRANKVVEKVRSRFEPKPPPAPKSHIEIFSRQVIDGYKRAQKLYHPPQYEGDALLYRAKNAELPFERAGNKLGWDGILTGNMEVVVLDADHYNILRTPNIEAVAEDISRRLEALDAETTPVSEVA